MSDCKEDTDTYEGYTFHTWCDGEHAETWVWQIILNDPDRKFWTGIDTEESDEYYDTQEEAHTAACTYIDRMMSGPDEPDYDAPTSYEIYLKAHEDRRKLRGY
jgi:hypothetical protein